MTVLPTLLTVHKISAYGAFFAMLAVLLLAMTNARTEPRVARTLRNVHGLGLVWLGRISLLTGVALIFVSDGISLSIPWVWGSVAAWVVLEMAAGSWVHREINRAESGKVGSVMMIVGAFVELVCVITILYLMTARP